MDKKRIEEYHKIEIALRQIRKDIKSYSKRAEAAKGKLIPDIAKGSSPEFPYIETKMKIESYDDSTKYKWFKRLRIREAEYALMIEEVEEWLNKISDPLIYTIFAMKLRNNLTHTQIGKELGYSRQRIDQLVNTYLKQD